MTSIKSIQQYLNRNNIDIAFVFAILGMLMSSFINYAWMISILACLFVKNGEKEVDEIEKDTK